MKFWLENHFQEDFVVFLVSKMPYFMDLQHKVLEDIKSSIELCLLGCNNLLNLTKYTTIF